MKDIFLIIILVLTFVSILISQTIEWSEPEVIETEHEGRYYDMFVDSENRVWLAWYGGYVTVKCCNDSIWSETDTLWRDSEMIYGNPAFGESQDGKIWIFVEDNSMENSFVRGAFIDSGTVIDSFVFDPPLGTNTLKPIAVSDGVGNLGLFMLYYYYYLAPGSTTWLGPYVYDSHYEVPIDAVLDTSGVLYLYSDVMGGFPNSILRTRVEIGADTSFASESVLEHGYLDWLYSNFQVESDGDIFLVDGMYQYTTERYYVRALYKNGTTVDSVDLDSSSASGSTERQIRNTHPVTQDSLGRYWFSWKIEKWGPNDSAYIAIYDTIAKSIDTILSIADSTIYGIVTDNVGRIWMLLGADDRLMVKHTLNHVIIPETNSKANLPVSTIDNIFPNPSNSSVCFKLAISEKGYYVLDIYSILGEKVDNINCEVLNPGLYNLAKDYKNIESGIYFVALRKNGIVISYDKLLLLK